MWETTWMAIDQVRVHPCGEQGQGSFTRTDVSRLPNFIVLSEQRDMCNHPHTQTHTGIPKRRQSSPAWVQAGAAGQDEEGDTFSLRMLHTFRILYQAHLSPTKNP